MDELTFAQKALRPVINFLVEKFFPSGAFYGNTFFDAFKEVEGNGEIGQASVAWIVHGMDRMNADTLTVSIEGMSISGRPVGDFEIVGKLSRPVTTKEPNDGS